MSRGGPAAAEEAAAVAGWGKLLPAGRPGRCPRVSILGQMLMSLQAMKSAHDPVVVGLARMVQE